MRVCANIVTCTDFNYGRNSSLTVSAPVSEQFQQLGAHVLKSVHEFME